MNGGNKAESNQRNEYPRYISIFTEWISDTFETLDESYRKGRGMEDENQINKNS